MPPTNEIVVLSAEAIAAIKLRWQSLSVQYDQDTHESVTDSVGDLIATIEALQAKCEALEKLYGHLAKRLNDEYGVEVTEEWQARVLSGEHDVPLGESNLYDRIRALEKERDVLKATVEQLTTGEFARMKVEHDEMKARIDEGLRDGARFSSLRRNR